MKNFTCVILGSYINSYSIIRELSIEPKCRIILLYHRISIACFSNIPFLKVKINNTIEDISKELSNLIKIHGRLYVFATDDLHLENLAKLDKTILEAIVLPFKTSKVAEITSKSQQYNICKK